MHKCTELGSVMGGVERALPNGATATTGSDYGVGPNIDPSPFQIGAEQKFVPRETAAAARRALTPRLYTEKLMFSFHLYMTQLFTFVFPIQERTLSSSRNCEGHNQRTRSDNRDSFRDMRALSRQSLQSVEFRSISPPVSIWGARFDNANTIDIGQPLKMFSFTNCTRNSKITI